MTGCPSPPKAAASGDPRRALDGYQVVVKLTGRERTGYLPGGPNAGDPLGEPYESASLGYARARRSSTAGLTMLRGRLPLRMAATSWPTRRRLATYASSEK